MSAKPSPAEIMQQSDLQKFLSSDSIARPWFQAYRHIKTSDQDILYFSALVPPAKISELIRTESWDMSCSDGSPSIWTHRNEKIEETHVYCPFGNEEGIEPLVIYREFHGIRPSFYEISQEFRLYHSLFHDIARKQYLKFDEDGNESEAVHYDHDFIEIRTDLLLSFCAAKQMAVAVYVDSCRYHEATLDELGLAETRTPFSGKLFTYHLAIVPDAMRFDERFKTFSKILGKKYILPEKMPSREREKQAYQDFIIGNDEKGTPIKHTCDPEELSNYFGKNPGSPNYLTPVFFRAEVLSKYYFQPQKYTVQDGYLRCGGLWGVHIDNDHKDYVSVFLGDLGSDMSEAERSYWLSYNIPPNGRKISRTNFQRSFMAVPTDPQRVDLVFRHEYVRFKEDFKKQNGWDFFLPLHEDDFHFSKSLRLLTDDDPSQFDGQLLGLTKLIVDSLNEKEIAKHLKTRGQDDKGITKLEKLLTENGFSNFEKHVKFLRVLQDLRSKSAVHRKGANYEKLVQELQMKDEGQRIIFEKLLIAAIDLIEYLKSNFCEIGDDSI